MLVSFNLASNRPENFRAFLDNLEATANDPRRLEVLVKIDDEDAAMQALTDAEKQRRPFPIKVLSSPKGKGYFDLWKSINALHALCDPKAYFVCNLNDEIRFKTKGWDTSLEKYVGFFPDHIFRLATSVSKFRNYADFWECGYARENYPFATKRWIDIQGDWNPCHGPDAYQQFVSFHLTRATWPSKEQYKRDVPIWDFEIGGEGIYEGLSEEDMWLRVQRGWKTWWRILSPAMQREASRRAHHLLAHIWAHENKLTDYRVVESRWQRRVRTVDNSTGRIVRSWWYEINAPRIVLTNLWRRPNKYRLCGGRPPPLRMKKPFILARRFAARLKAHA